MIQKYTTSYDSLKIKLLKVRNRIKLDAAENTSITGL